MIEENENLIRDTVEKEKSLFFFGLKDKVMPDRHEIEEYEKK